jgi:hypothetical protein
VNDEFREAVALFPWFDTKTIIKSRLGGWRACFPNARAANISEQKRFVDADFVHLKGIHALNTGWCNQAGITDAAFVHLKGVHTLDMRYCRQAGITQAVLPLLAGIHTLQMRGCNQLDIMDVALQT